MQLNKPQGFRSGAAIDFKQLAMANQNMQVANLMPDASAPVGDVQRRELPSPGITEALKQGFDKSNEATKIKKNVEAIDEGRNKVADGIMSLSPKEDEKALNETNADDIKLFVPKQEINERQRQDLQKQATAEKLGVEATSNPSLFSDAEKKGIFAANLARI